MQKEKRLPILIGTMISQLGLGTIYTWSLFNQPLVNKFGWSLNNVATAFSIVSFFLAFSTLFAGKLQERFGIRKLVSVAGVVLGLGLILCAKATSIPVLYVAALVVGAADGIAYLTLLTNCIKWYPEKKGLISGLSIGAYGVGSIVFKYVNAELLSADGVAETFVIWGIISIILVVLGARFVRDAQVQQNTSNTSVDGEFTVREMLKTKEAYLLFIMFFTACMSGLYLIGIVKDIGVKLAGLDVATAANAVALVALFNTVGRFILGTLSDKIGRIKVTYITFAITAIAVVVLSFVNLNFPIFFTCVAAIAFCFGGNITVFPPIVGEFFGLRNQTKNYGIIYQGFGIGAIAGSIIASITGGFKPTFIVVGVLCVVSLIIGATIKPPKKKAISLI